MAKYILKRLGLSIIILLGVSIIIYFLVRLMPTDYLETKFSSQLREGTITEEQLDDFRKRYGLYMPDAFLELVMPAGALGATQFQADTKQDKHEDAVDGGSFAEFYATTYSCDADNVYLEITAAGDGSNAATYRVVDKTDILSPKELAKGTLTASEGRILLQDGTEIEVIYEVAGFWDKFGAVLSGYFSWLGNMLQGDLGDSFIYQKPVGTVIAEHMWISFLISLVALILQFAIAIPMGITSATHQYSVRDYSVTIITMIGISLPSFFFAALLIKIFSSWLGWLPASGLVSGSSSAVGFAYFLDMLSHLILPMTVLVVLSIGGLMRYTRTNMLEVLNSDYIRTARAKGLSEKKVIYVHAFRNTMIPLMTLLAGILPSLFGGAMITEEVFSIDGIGRLAYKALQQGDVPFIMGYNMFLAVLTVIGTLFSDLMYAVVDPRVKLSK
jgi:peptide/nickel transport system permease protein